MTDYSGLFRFARLMAALPDDSRRPEALRRLEDARSHATADLQAELDAIVDQLSPVAFDPFSRPPGTNSR